MNLYCAGNKATVHRRGYWDNHYRAFVGYPEMADGVRDMIRQWAKKKKYGHIYLFFCEKCGYDVDYSGFLMREAIAGKI